MNIKGKANRYLLPQIYYFLGGFEKNFGTKTAAIDYYKKSISEAKKIGFVETVLDSKIGIAECYSDNNNLKQAYKEFVSAFKFAKAFQLKNYLGPIADDLSEVCAKLELTSQESKYKKYADKHEVSSGKEESLEGLNKFTDAINSGDFEESLKQYELFLAKQREILGESSPMYKDWAQWLWVFYALNNQKDQALRYLNESISFFSSTHGENSMQLAECLARAAHMMPFLAEFEYTYNFANRAIDICNRNHENNSYTYFQAKLALANVALITGKKQEAEGYIKDIDFSLFSGNDFIENTVQIAGAVLAELSKYNELEPMCLNLLSKKNAADISKFQANILMSIMKEHQGYLDEAEKYADESTRYVEFIKTTHIKDGLMVQYYRARARLDFRKGKNEAAAKKLDEMIDLFNEDEKDKFILYPVYLERGLYYSFCRNHSAAMKDFEQCERILKNNHCPKENFFVLYNNIAINYQRVCDYEKSMDFLNKAAKSNPNVFNPTTYDEALACANFGWLSYLLGDLKKSEKYLDIAIKSFEKLGVDKSGDYFALKCNLATVYAAKKRYEEAIDMFLDIRRKYSPASDASGEFASNTCEGILKAYFESDQPREAYDFACKEVSDLEQWFGKYSMVRINEIIEIGEIFRANGYTDCYDFFTLAEELLCDSDQTKTVKYAIVLNYIGVCKADYEKKHIEACRYFEKSKELFEKLGETDNENYRTVLNNLAEISDLYMDELAKNLANSFVGKDDEDNDNDE